MAAHGPETVPGYYVTLIRCVPHAADTEDAVMAAVKGADEIVVVDVLSADARSHTLLTAQDVPR